MIQRLFVYGTLGPGRPNEHVLTEIGGEFEQASVKGFLREAGWGAEMGYPGIDLDDNGDNVQGFLFCSAHLEQNWSKLDDFEGEGYERTAIKATKANGEVVDAFIYQLS